MSAGDRNPLVAARPPATDYMTYLTILEYNVNKENLSLLNEILQDVQLTVNIGWDLIQVLIPLLPESQECLRTVAKLGNPREVLLKVTESLSSIDWNEESDQEEVDKSVGNSKEESQEHIHHAPLSVLQFEVLVQMLSVLHSRLKTKVPSRFAATTLQAVLRSIENCQFHKNSCTDTCLELTETLSRKVRPVLPPRDGSSAIPAVAAVPKAADPEGTEEDLPSKDELELVNRLLQSFVTHLLEYFIVDDHESPDDIPDMAWSARLQEYIRPEKTPSAGWYQKQFLTEGSHLRNRDTLIHRFVDMSYNLAIEDRGLQSSITQIHNSPPGPELDDGDLPKSAQDVPLATEGSLHLLIARQFALVAAGKEQSTELGIFPDHAKVIEVLMGSTFELPFVSITSDAVLDSILAYGLLGIENRKTLTASDEDAIRLYLRKMSVISGSTSSPCLRYAAHLITTTVLSQQESERLRYDFILATLEQDSCEPLWTSAVGWFKDETTAVASSIAAEPGSQHLFGRPDTLDAIGSYIFKSPEALYQAAMRKNLAHFGAQSKLDVIQKDISFSLAGLNFYYMLFASERLRAILEADKYHKEHNMRTDYLQPWGTVAAQLRAKALETSSDNEASLSLEPLLLQDVLDRIFLITENGADS